MSGGRFKIPSSEEINKTNSSQYQPSTLFNAYKTEKLTIEKGKRSGEVKNVENVSSAGGDAVTGDQQQLQQSEVPASSNLLKDSKQMKATIQTPCKVNLTASEIVTVAPAPQSSAAAAALGHSNSLLVSVRQRGNPLLKHVKHVPWSFGDIIPDYQMGKSNCALFLSLRYHNLNGNYIHERMKELGKSYDLRILLVQVDIKDPHHALKELTKICILAEYTLILAWSCEEAGKYIEAYKVYEHKPADSLKEKTDKNFLSRMTDCLTSVKSVNKTDASTLMSKFGNFKNIAQSDRDTLSACPGLGPQKADRLYKVFNIPFKKPVKRLLQVPGSGPIPPR
ncbi:DNA excision repair protein ERCC-1-like [Tubulanus polymorphus]|uniref:DNA excision repair protein ERCC-1-like n=1 Tax=Tubulanus polymorphus TaxID=672921 RepID=UPI003DA30F0C